MLRFFCIFAALALSACAAPQTRTLLESRTIQPSRIELAAVPFFPQTEHECGPAALATVLNHSGITVTPEALTAQVYLPGREGSLAIELIAAARLHNRIAWRIPPTMTSVLNQVAAGQPVLFLQNRSLSFAPLWHYAVMVGYDLDQREVILRSGTMQREIMSLDAFERTWARGDYWAVIISQPDTLPEFVGQHEAMQQALALEKITRTASAHAVYAQISARWPEYAPARFGLANTAYALGNGTLAEAQWRLLLAQPQPLLPVFHNLGQYLLEQNRADEAKIILQQALQRWPNDPRLLSLKKILQTAPAK